MLALPRRPTTCLALVCLTACGAGCANLEVKKVPLAERAANADREQGFRYYLNRPYVVVKKPITVVESICLVRAAASVASGKEPGPRSAASALQPDQVVLTFLSGPHQGQSVRLADLQVESPGTGVFRPVSLTELQAIHKTLGGESVQAGSKPTGPGEQLAALDDGALVSDVSGVNMTTSSMGAAFAGGGAGQGDSTGSSDSSASGASLQQPTLAGVQHTPPLTGDMAILYLPDLDEQYVIKSCNLVAKSAFGLAFRNGSELVEVQGDHDSTAFPLALLQQVQKAIAAAQGVEEQRAAQQLKSLKATQGAAMMEVRAAPGDQLVWQLIERTSIKPGVYRLNKPWEIEEGHAPQPTGCGLLAKLGLPTVTEIDFKPAATIGK
jgi:hypothetical protein